MLKIYARPILRGVWRVFLESPTRGIAQTYKGFLRPGFLRRQIASLGLQLIFAIDVQGQKIPFLASDGLQCLGAVLLA